MPLYIAQSGDLERCHGCLTDRQTLKDRATQLHIKYKSGALVTQKLHLYSYKKTQIPILIFNNILIIETLVSWETPKILLGGFLPANGVHPPGPPSSLRKFILT